LYESFTVIHLSSFWSLTVCNFAQIRNNHPSMRNAGWRLAFVIVSSVALPGHSTDSTWKFRSLNPTSRKEAKFIFCACYLFDQKWFLLHSGSDSSKKSRFFISNGENVPLYYYISSRGVCDRFPEWSAKCDSLMNLTNVTEASIFHCFFARLSPWMTTMESTKV
jgi:hypothetical protein